MVVSLSLDAFLLRSATIVTTSCSDLFFDGTLMIVSVHAAGRSVIEFDAIIDGAELF